MTSSKTLQGSVGALSEYFSDLVYRYNGSKEGAAIVGTISEALKTLCYVANCSDMRIQSGVHIVANGAADICGTLSTAGYATQRVERETLVTQKTVTALPLTKALDSRLCIRIFEAVGAEVTAREQNYHNDPNIAAFRDLLQQRPPTLSLPIITVKKEPLPILGAIQKLVRGFSKKPLSPMEEVSSFLSQSAKFGTLISELAFDSILGGKATDGWTRLLAIVDTVMEASYPRFDRFREDLAAKKFELLPGARSNPGDLTPDEIKLVFGAPTAKDVFPAKAAADAPPAPPAYTVRPRSGVTDAKATLADLERQFGKARK